MKQRWSFLDEIATELDTAGHELPVGVGTIISDRVIAAVSGETRAELEHAQSALEAFYLNRLSKVPKKTVDAATGKADPNSAEAGAFSLGQIGFAHAIVARAASRRADDEFERRLRSRPLERYVRLLISDELSGRDISDRLNKDPAEVSRRLKILRQIGAVECRREGNRVVNYLTPAAAGIARARNMGAVSCGAQLQTEVVEALDDHKKRLPPELQGSLILVMGRDRFGR